MPDYTDNLDQNKLNPQEQDQPKAQDSEPVVLPKYVKPVKTAADWARDLRFSADVNKTTVGVDSDRVTPDLVLATATKLLGISKGSQEPDPKDSLQFQRFYGPAEYFAQHVTKDGGKVARNLLWKATNRGNLDFINSNSLEPHVTSVFFDSNLAQFIDGSTPFDAIDATYKTTRVGQGGLQSPDSAPDEMRLVQPSYFGYVDPVRCYSADTWIYTKSGWIQVAQMNMQTQFACLIDNHMEWHKPLDVTSYKYKGIMYGYQDGITSYLVTPKHKMYVKASIKATHLEPPNEATGFTKVYVQEIHGKSCIMMQDLYHFHELQQSGFYTEDYDGTVYCPSVPGGLVFIRKSLTSRGIWCSNTAERGEVGLTGYLTKNVLKGSDGKLYQTFYNARTKKYQLVDSVTAAKSIMASAQYKDSKDKSIFAVGGKTGARIVDKDKVDYYADKPDDLFSLGSNLVPMLSGIKQMRLLMGCLCPWTPVVQINEAGYVQIVQAIHAGMHGQVKMFSLQDDLTDKMQSLRGSHARIPDKSRPFIKVVLDSGRVLPTSPDHKWVVYKGTKLVKVKADKLKPGMQIPRTIFNNAPSKQTYMLGVKLTPQIGALLACIVKGFQFGSYGRRCPFPEQLLPRIKLAVQQLNLDNCKVYKNRGICYIGLQNPRLIDWLQTQMGIDPAKRRIPSVVLSSYKSVVAGFIDAYTIQGLNIGYDVDGDVWILQIPNNILRDGLAYLFARIYTDTLFRDHKDEDGTIHRALLLKPIAGVLGQSVVLDKIKSIVPVGAPGMMIDLDVNDNVYAVANGIVTHNSKYATQAVPLEHRQAPLVRPVDSDTNKDMQTLLGRKLGAKFAPKPGVVAAVRRDRVDMVYDDGTKGSISLYNAFPANAKGWLQNTVQVKAGQHLNADDVVASSNYTTPTGQAAMGTNLHIGYLSYKGKTYQDACVVSESAAKKLASTTMYKTGIDLQKSIKTGKSTYQSWKPGQYKKQQLQMLDDTGVVKPGTVLKRGDPMILAVRLQQPSPGTLGKRVITDVSQTWDHMHDGVVTDVVKTNNGIKVYATVTAPLQVGDKMSGAYGNKNVVAQILPDEQMPKDEKGNTLDALLSPLGIVSRTNPSQLVQAALGKVARKTGQTIYMPQFQDYDMVQYAKDMCKKYNVPWKESIQDPQTGRKISNVFTGDAYFYKLKHIADTKMSSRGTDQYTAQGVPASGGKHGSKRFGTMESAAMVGHGAFQTLVTDAKLIRGQSNAAFWRSLRTGEVPVVPGQPLVHRKFFAHLQGSGMQIRKTPKGISIFAMTNKDAKDLSASRQLKTRSTYQTNTFRPIDGGLFGQDVFGKQGKQWGYIQLDQPIPNPVMEQPIARLLNIGVKQLQDVVAGEKQVNGMKSAQDVKQALAKIDLKRQKAKAIQAFKAAPQSKKDNLLKRYVAVANMQKNVDNAADYMLDRIPVLPPQFRPVTSHSGLTMVADSNYLYAQLLDARNDLRDAKGLPDEYKQQATKNLYRSFKQLVGLYQPQNKKLQAKNVKGLLGWALGRTSKLSAFNRKVLGSTVDTVGRGVVVPDSRIPLDTVGLPQDMAWDVFSPFVTRALVKANYTPVDALKQIKERTPQARQMLLNIMEKRPVMMNRAPTLHKLSIMGFKPRLVGGYAIKVNPSIVVPFGMDFDGNCCDFDSEIILKLSKSVLDTLRQSCYSIVNKPIQEFTMLDKQASIDVVSEMAVVRMKIGDFPKEGFPVKDSKGADVYRVADDIEVLGCDPVTGKQGFYPVYGFTEEHDCATVDVTVGGRHIIVSNNESMAAFDATSGCLEKVAPTEVGNRLVPVLRKSPVPFGTYGDRDLGWLLGAVLSDGWISNNIVGYCKQEQSKRDEFVRISRKFHENFTLHTYTQEGTGDKKKLGNSVKVHLSSATFANWLREFNLVADNSGTTRAALNKQLEQRFIDAGSEEFLFGVLSGLLDGDGSIVKNTSKTKARFSFRFATSSSLLRDSVCNLAYRLGIRYSVTTVPPRGFSGEAYIVLLSVIDMYNSVDKLSCIGSSETSMLADLRNTPPAPDKLDQIPLSTAEVDFLKPISRAHNDKSLYTALTGSRKLVPSCARYILEPYAEILEEALPVLAHRIKTVDTIWCPVDSIEDAGKRSVYDIMVDEAKVYAINNGVIIWDTVNIHAPVSAKAVDQVYNKMLPQRNLIAMRSGKIAYRPQKQYIQGLYVATNMDNSKPAIPFASLQEAKQAFRQGKIDVDTPIIIKG